MAFSFYIAKRYLFTKSSSNAINIISKIAAIGVVFAAALLLIVLSGFAGLKTFSLSYASVIDPDFKILPATGKQLHLSPTEIEQLQKHTNIVSYSKLIEEKVFLKFKEQTALATIKGVDSHYTETVNVTNTLFSGQWLAQNSNQTVTGALLAEKLNLGVFDYAANLEIYVPKPGKGSLNRNAFYTLTAQNVGLFDVNDVLNQELLFTSLAASKELLHYPENTFSAIVLKTEGLTDEDLFRTTLHQIFKQPIKIKNRLELNDALHKMLNTENIAVYLIFTLILIIALFNVIGAIIMMIIDKKDNLKTLFNLGTTISDIKKIFFLQGALLTFIGGCVGVLLGCLLVGSQLVFEYITIPGTAIPYPVELSFGNIVLVLLTIFILGLLASKIASYRISKTLLTR